MLTAAALAVLLQVGPNPSTGAVPGLPPEILDWREMERQKESANVTLATRLDNCLERAEEDTTAALLEAEDWLTRADGIESAQALHCRGFSQALLARWSDAAKSFTAAREAVGEEDIKYRARLGAIAANALLTAGDLSSALAALDLAGADAAAAEFAPLSGEIQIDRARALHGLGRNEEASAALANARRLSPGNPQAWLLSATLARKADRLTDAQVYILQAEKLSPADPAILLEAGVIAVLSGDDAAARSKWEEVIALPEQSAQKSAAQTYLRQLDAL